MFDKNYIEHWKLRHSHQHISVALRKRNMFNKSYIEHWGLRHSYQHISVALRKRNMFNKSYIEHWILRHSHQHISVALRKRNILHKSSDSLFLSQIFTHRIESEFRAIINIFKDNFLKICCLKEMFRNSQSDTSSKLVILQFAQKSQLISMTSSKLREKKNLKRQN